MATGLPVSNIIDVTIDLANLAPGRRNFGTLLILGPSTVIDTGERIRKYSGLDDVAADFGLFAPEYLAARDFFSQRPRPSEVYVGRWAQTATTAALHGGFRSLAQRDVGVFNSVVNGSLSILVNGVAKTVSGLNLSTQTNLNGVADALGSAIGGVVVTWDAKRARFDVVTAATGASATLGYATATGSGTDLAGPLGLTSGVASAPVGGRAAESLVEAVQLMAERDGDWYAVTAAAAGVPDIAHLAAAAYIEGSPLARVYGITTQDPRAVDPTSTADLPYLLHAAGYENTVIQYSSLSPYAVSSFLGRALTVDFTANNSTLTMMFKSEPGVVAETLTTSQAEALKAKCCNVFVNYANGVGIIQHGVMSSGSYFDEIHGTDWLQNSIQVNVFDLFYGSARKVPQTEDGVHLVVTTIEDTCAGAVANGLLAPGVWTREGFGQLEKGMMLPAGYYVYAPPLATQAQTDRERRHAPPIQVAAKLAGAIHDADVLVSVNR